MILCINRLGGRCLRMIRRGNCSAATIFTQEWECPQPFSLTNNPEGQSAGLFERWTVHRITSYPSYTSTTL